MVLVFLLWTHSRKGSQTLLPQGREIELRDETKTVLLQNILFYLAMDQTRYINDDNLGYI